MTPERWQRIEQLYHQARNQPAADRAAFLAVACADDEPLRLEIESLLDASGSDDGFLAEPAIAAPAEDATRTVVRTMSGGSLGGYEIRSMLGAGGMGEVYQAHDSRLGREVAIKVLPPAFTRHPDRLARFEREARMLAALNHPNICGIYGFEESDGARFLVLELVEGDTLAEKLSKGAGRDGRTAGLPLEQVMAIARQIAEALDVAHEKGIVHRDLKPANIKITPDGLVKVLDFGLAKPVAGAGLSSDLSNAGVDDGGGRAVVGTAAYMSPEQARGLPVDRRTDIWAFGCVLYEMLTGRVTFAGDTISDSIAKILEREPEWSALPVTTPAPVRRILLRCLAKDPKKRARDIGDVRLELDAVEEVLPGAVAAPVPPTHDRRVKRWAPWVALTALALAVGVWEARRPAPFENPLPSEGFKPLTNWPGSEGHAEISPDGKLVAFLADRDGEIDLFSSQIGTNFFNNLTRDQQAMNPVAILRWTGFSDDSARVWFNVVTRQKIEMPWSGGTPLPFLVDGAHTPAWSSDGRLVYFNNTQNDALWLADAAGRNAQKIQIDWPALAGTPEQNHSHNMVWSPDNQWIYFVHGEVRDWNHQTNRMDIWRVRPSGGTPERLTYLNDPLTFLAILDLNTLVFVAPGEDGFGSWLWSLDVGQLGGARAWLGAGRPVPRRIPTGTQQYVSVSASRDGATVVATQANPTATLWSVPILADREALETEVVPVQLQVERALAPRYARRSAAPLLFFLSARGTADRVWRFANSAVEITRGAEGRLVDAPAPAPDGTRLAIVAREAGRRRLSVMNQDGQGSQILAGGIDVQDTPDWSPDGTTIAVGGSDEKGTGLFAIPVDGGSPRRLVSETATDPVWSPNGDFIVYAGSFSGGTTTARVAGAPLKAVRPDGTKYDLPQVLYSGQSRENLRVSPAGYRFLDQTHLIYRPLPEAPDFWMFDLVTGSRRQLTRLANKGSLRGFDITPDGRHIVFDRTRQNSDVVLIERVKARPLVR
jgi:serine/threonine protein kinase